ncbi:MAG: hypothetical protein H7301_08775 [Cryobacterium sp.]|nr:hypothetical protein [Oligoflexia bacterium]
MNKSILDENQLLTADAMVSLVSLASDLKCECPKHLVSLLSEVRGFTAHESQCIASSEKDRDTHEWLRQSSVNIDRMLSGTIAQLARLEGMIDSDNAIIQHPSAPDGEI